jgi:lysozyme
MSNSVELLSSQMQNNMLSQLLEVQNSGSGAFGASSGSTGLTFENLLESYLNGGADEALQPESSEDFYSLLQGLGVYGSPQISGVPSTVGGMSASSSLVNFVKGYEGYSPVAYRGADVQNQTIGYGHVIEPGESYSVMSESQATGLLQNDLSGSVASVNKEFAGTNLSQNQFDALVSFAYNLGNNVWSSAPTLVNDVKSGASAEKLKADFTQYDHCNGVELKGLYNRRLDEWSMFTSGDYSRGN